MDNPAGRKTEEVVIPVVAEQLHVDTVAIPRGGVRVTKRSIAVEHPVVAHLREQHAEVKRVEINTEVDGPQPIRHTENSVIIPIVEEEVTIQRRWVLREELHLLRTETVREYRDSVLVSHDEVSVERMDS